eukprot:TRINITY_DN2658_c0_g1_i1.p2 TRINITY_DN2658_c0_g1~~TRINITY_DN2658_c0_g1_i1.p2  ORF type:complete len:258 (+),score=47.99 TRINITY_DN2658_c0_g1_i1:2232-3005(+)
MNNSSESSITYSDHTSSPRTQYNKNSGQSLTSSSNSSTSSLFPFNKTNSLNSGIAKTSYEESSNKNNLEIRSSSTSNIPPTSSLSSKALGYPQTHKSPSSTTPTSTVIRPEKPSKANGVTGELSLDHNLAFQKHKSLLNKSKTIFPSDILSLSYMRDKQSNTTMVQNKVSTTPKTVPPKPLPAKTRDLDIIDLAPTHPPTLPKPSFYPAPTKVETTIPITHPSYSMIPDDELEELRSKRNKDERSETETEEEKNVLS